MFITSRFDYKTKFDELFTAKSSFLWHSLTAASITWVLLLGAKTLAFAHATFLNVQELHNDIISVAYSTSLILPLLIMVNYLVLA